MPWVKTMFGGLKGLVDATDDEIRQCAITYNHLYRDLTEEEIQQYIKDYRIAEKEKLETEQKGSYNSYVVIALDDDAQKSSSETKKESTTTSSNFSSSKLNSKDKSADKRAEYAQKIMFKEQEMDDLGQLERNFENRNDQFLSDANRHFYESEELSQQRNQYPSQQSRFQESVLQEAYGQAKWTANRQQETFQESSRVARIEIEDKIESLYKERSALPW
ncbi:hypothetical protein [Lactococcus allomyrinae]|uniref:Uncharacterized protein n=1 Tax=Lactococcus allomyrinae TaxID=2419773 RepID=A0A387BEX8_9LACT|nr:hypothetical protein [Lactococcus allomyrinae]AYG01128.1 hypothetical protein D7I46_08495 [Lactococcus allomyrinae]